MKKIVLTLLFLSVIASLMADPRSVYLELIQKEEYVELRTHLDTWIKESPRDPEVYIAFFNYLVRRNMKTGVEISKEIDRRKSHMVITDPKSGKIVGYMGDRTYYEYEDIKSAVEYLDKALVLDSDRLDIHFGKIYILGEIGDYGIQSQAVIKLLQRSSINSNKWLWTMNEKLEDGEKILINSLQDYYQQWIDRNTESSLDALYKAASMQKELYPNNVYAYNNLSYYYQKRNQNELALKTLLEAEAIDRSDYIILGNIGMLYEKEGKLDLAKKYYLKIMALGEVESTKWAKAQLDKIEP